MSETNGTGKVGALLPWRLVRLDLKKAGESLASLHAVGAPVSLAMTLISNASTGAALVEIARQEAVTAAAAFAETEQAVANSELAQKVIRLEASLTEARQLTADSEAAVKASKIAVRAALAGGTGLEAAEKAGRKAREQVETYGARVEGLTPLLSAARTAADQARAKAISTKRAEQRLAAEDAYHRAEDAATRAISTVIADLVKARAAVQCLRIGPSDLAEQMQERHDAAVRQQIESLRRPTLQLAQAMPPKRQVAMLDGPLEPRLPEGVEAWNP